MTEHRVLDLRHGFNFRELGGYPTTTGQTVKWHTLIRSAHLADLTCQELGMLYDYGIRTVIDFRSTSEVAAYPDHLSSFFQYYRVPVFDNDVTESNATVEEIRQYFSSSPQAGFDRMMRVYRQLVISTQSQRAYQTFLKLLVCAGSKGGVLFHCSAGKDRTGLGAILLLSLLQVPRDLILKDYLLTNSHSTRRVAQRLEYARQLNMNACYLQSIKDLSTVNEYYYDQAMALIDYQYGGIQRYLCDILKIEPAVITQLREMYLLKA